MRKRVCIYICVRVFMFVYVCVDAKYGVCEFYVCMHGCILFRLPYFRASLTKLLGELTIKVKKTPADLMAARVWNEQVNQVKISCRLYCHPYCVYDCMYE